MIGKSSQGDEKWEGKLDAERENFFPPSDTKKKICRAEAEKKRKKDREDRRDFLTSQYSILLPTLIFTITTSKSTRVNALVQFRRCLSDGCFIHSLNHGTLPLPIKVSKVYQLSTFSHFFLVFFCDSFQTLLGFISQILAFESKSSQSNSGLSFHIVYGEWGSVVLSF